MDVPSRILRFFAVRLLRDEWCDLQKKLANLYCSYRDARYDPPILAQQLLISGEDHRFFRHGGIDLIAVGRAIWRYIAKGRREGAGTIEMQIVRIVTGRFELTLGRKTREMALATLLTHLIPKQQLPSLYLQIGYYGWRMNGFREACQRLGIDANLVAPAEVARLVARLKYPQPRLTSSHRWRQIYTRGEYLLRLHLRYRSGEIYLKLDRPIVDTYEAV
jgi:membrane peptidoglycan carboxypeptidase